MNKILFFILLIIIVFSECKSIHKVEIGNRKIKDINKLIEKIDKNQIDYQWFRAKTKVNYKSDKINQNFILHLKMRKDSLIWGSISAALGVELIRFIITEDSMKFVDRFNRKYFSGPSAYVYELFPIIDINIFSLFENLILGNILFTIDETYSLSGDKQTTQLNKKNTDYNKTIYLSNQDYHVTGYLIENILLNQRITIDYQGKISNKGISIPETIQIKSLGKHFGNINIDIASIQFNKPGKFNFSIPNSYERMD